MDGLDEGHSRPQDGTEPSRTEDPEGEWQGHGGGEYVEWQGHDEGPDGEWQGQN